MSSLPGAGMTSGISALPTRAIALSYCPRRKRSSSPGTPKRGSQAGAEAWRRSRSWRSPEVRAADMESIGDPQAAALLQQLANMGVHATRRPKKYGGFAPIAKTRAEARRASLSERVQNEAGGILGRLGIKHRRKTPILAGASVTTPGSLRMPLRYQPRAKLGLKPLSWADPSGVGRRRLWAGLPAGGNRIRTWSRYSEPNCRTCRVAGERVRTSPRLSSGFVLFGMPFHRADGSCLLATGRMRSGTRPVDAAANWPLALMIMHPDRARPPIWPRTSFTKR